MDVYTYICMFILYITFITCTICFQHGGSASSFWPFSCLDVAFLPLNGSNFELYVQYSYLNIIFTMREATMYIWFPSYSLRASQDIDVHIYAIFLPIRARYCNYFCCISPPLWGFPLDIVRNTNIHEVCKAEIEQILYDCGSFLGCHINLTPWIHLWVQKWLFVTCVGWTYTHMY